MTAFFDGKFAKRHAAHARVDLRGLVIESETLPEPAVWPFDSLIVRAREGPQGPWTLSSSTEPQARFRLDDPAIFKQLAQKRPELAAARTRFRGLKKGLLVGGISAAIVGGLLFIIPYMAGPIAAAIPQEFEADFGRAVKRELNAQLTHDETGEAVCSGDAGLAALEDLKNRFATHLGGDFDYQIEVIESPLVNAFALPGGWIIMTDGLIKNAKTPDEVAAILAHEMAHVALRHSMQSVITDQGRAILLTLLSGGGGAPVAEMSAIALLYAGHSRVQEAEADKVAIELLNAENISTNGMAAFFERLAGDHGHSNEHRYLSTHPDLNARAEAARRDGLATGERALTPSAWLQLKHVCK